MKRFALNFFRQQDTERLWKMQAKRRAMVAARRDAQDHHERVPDLAELTRHTTATLKAEMEGRT